VSALLFNAFRALGPGPTRPEVGPLLDFENHPELWDRCSEMADEAGAYGFVQLDLAVAFHNPAISPA
jgi:hypothetical protein